MVRASKLDMCHSAGYIYVRRQPSLSWDGADAIPDGQSDVGYDPKYCYFEGGSLKFNSDARNIGVCRGSDECLCKSPTISSPTPGEQKF